MQPQIKVFWDPNECEIFIPKELLRDYLMGEQNLVFTLSTNDAYRLREKLEVNP